MKAIKLRTSILASFLFLVALLSISMSVLGFYVVKTYIMGEAQKQVNQNLKAIPSVYEKQIEKMATAFALVRSDTSLEELKKMLGLDYLYQITLADAVQSHSEIVQKAIATRQPSGGKRILEKGELLAMGKEYFEKVLIEIQSTPQAHPHPDRWLEKAIGLEYAKPLLNPHGEIAGVLFGGKIFNKNFQLVDEVSDTVFEKKLFRGKPVGTVTIFLDDTRVATNVLNDRGERAIGTIVSDSVYKKVVEKGEKWQDRAFVVTDWYLTAYEPIKNIQDKIIGIRYVGILEKPFVELQRNLFLAILAIITCITLIAIVLSVVFSRFLTNSFLDMFHSIGRLARGDLRSKVRVHTTIQEIGQLTESFNQMAEKLQERELRLKITNEQLAALNKSYLDMIGFVSHELKGILGSIVMNVYSVKDGYLGELNAAQKKAINAAARSLDHFESMVKNYLDLSRIEKGELEVRKEKVLFREAILQPAIQHFEKQRQERGMNLEDRVPAGIELAADKSLLGIVCNNLLGNALKYGKQGGRVVIAAEDKPDRVELRFFNEGCPIPEKQKEHLFRRFSRLPGSEHTKGTGLGLFIIKEIIEKHGGKVGIETQTDGNVFTFTLPKT
jgi:signal transduction histidine kinase